MIGDAQTRASDLERLEWICSRLALTEAGDVRLRSLLVIAHEALRRRTAEEDARSEATAASPPPLAGILGSRVEDVPDYAALVAQVRATAESEVPEGAHVLVVSRGDPELLHLRGRTAGHFPQGASGEWAGFYPADGAAAVGHLTQLLDQGYEFLVFPSYSRWWLDYYADLAQLLECSGRLVHHGPACTIFQLGWSPGVTG
jgi:hypothetical protein